MAEVDPRLQEFYHEIAELLADWLEAQEKQPDDEEEVADARSEAC